MADYLVLEWDPQCLRGVDVHVSGGTLQVRHAFEMPQPSGHEQPALKEWFNHYLAEKQITTKQVIVTVPRENVVVRRLELPDAPDDELPVMVRFQAAAKSSLSLDELALDYIPLPRREGLPTREVLLAMVPQTMVAAIREFVSDGPRELVSIRLSPLGTAELATHVESQKQLDARSATLLLARHGERIEISVTWLRQLIFSHAARLSGENDEQRNGVILTEVSRGLMSFQNLNLGFKLTDGLIFGAEQEFPGLSESLQKRMPITTHLVNPFSLTRFKEGALNGIEHPSAYSGLLGAAFAQSQPGLEQINFLAPRRPVIKPDTRKARNRKLAIAGGVLGVLIVGAYWLKLNQLNTDIYERTDEIIAIDDRLKKGKPQLEAAKTIKQWVDEDANVLEEFQRFQQQLPGTDRIYLTKVTLRTPTNRQPEEIHAEGHARDEQDIRKLRERLIAPNTGYKPSADAIKSENKEYYPKKLNEQIRVTSIPDSSKSATTAQASDKTANQSPGNTTSNSASKSAAKPDAKLADKPDAKPAEQPASQTPMPATPAEKPDATVSPAVSGSPKSAG